MLKLQLTDGSGRIIVEKRYEAIETALSDGDCCQKCEINDLCSNTYDLRCVNPQRYYAEVKPNG